MAESPSFPNRRDLLIASAAVGAWNVLPAVAAKAAEGDRIRPFHVNIAEEHLADLRRRIAATRWPDRETVNDQSQGIPLAKIKPLVEYWGTGYDWRKTEAKLNALPQFVTQIDGVDIHFIHVRSKHPNALPLIINHGWPGSVLEQLKVVGPLDRSDGGRGERGGRVRPGYSVDAWLRLFRQADGNRLGPRPHRADLGRADEAPRI